MLHTRPAFLLILLIGPAVAAADEGASPRHTATVELIRRSLPAVVAIRAYSVGEKPEITNIDHGSGSVIHPQGFILTNHHVIKRAERVEAIFADGRILPARIVARYAQEDLAVLKVDAESPFRVLPIGRSHDLMLGEPVLVIGTPAGLEHSVSTGIISGLARAATTQDAFLPWMIQTSAAVNGGNSGGPLINAEGEQIGVVTAKKNDAENINFAIAIDRVWELFPRIASAEVRGGFQIGCEVPLAHRDVIVADVAPESAAAQAGVQAGDVLTKIGLLEIRNSIDYHLALLEHQPGDLLPLELRRADATERLTITLPPMPLAEPTTDAQTTAGLNLAFFPGQFERLPAFSELKPTIEHPVGEITLNTITGARDHFAIRLTGFVKAPVDGLYTFYSLSDDGSRVFVGNRLVVDNDGLHGSYEASGMVRLKAGLHPLAVEYFEHSGGEVLTVSWEAPNLPKQKIPAAALFAPSTAK